MAIFPEEMLNTNQQSLTPEVIIGRLFHFHSQAHFLHLQTKSYAEHKALDGLYKSLVEFKDEISEKLLGYINSRLKNLPSYPFAQYTLTASVELCNEIMNFSLSLEKYAETNNFRDLANIAQSVHGLAAETRYLLSLS